jgi:hypothetical protein
MAHPIEVWHQIMAGKDLDALGTLLAEDVVFHSPVVHTPQQGKDITSLYLTAAAHVLGNDSFSYVREVIGDTDAVLEFTTEIDGITLNGVDMIRWNEQGQIVDFKVMVRPLKAVNLIHAKMAQMLESLK